MLSQSGYAANVGLLQVIADPETPVYLDGLAHMSLWEGVRAANDLATGGLVPDVTLLLQLPKPEAMARLQRRRAGPDRLAAQAAWR